MGTVGQTGSQIQTCPREEIQRDPGTNPGHCTYHMDLKSDGEDKATSGVDWRDRNI